MAKAKNFYRCAECGYECAKWMGKCPSCGSWNTLEEVSEAPAVGQQAAAAKAYVDERRIRPLSAVEASESQRKKTGIAELDRVLGGGIVPGSVVLAGGEPGIGKSTLFLQAADALNKAGCKVLYVSGEESAQQVKLRSDRLALSGSMLFLAETQLEVILAAAEKAAPDVLVIDSIQTVASSEVTSVGGSISQVRACAAALARLAKEKQLAVFLIGHVTKDGAIAGPRVLEHLVDTVLYFEGERHSAFRILRAVKNRFGSTNEIGVFEMGETGMREVPNPSAVMLSSRGKDLSGACVYCALEGTRPVLLEVEALVSETAFGTPRRMTTGADFNRTSLIIAVLEKKIGLKLYNQDVYVNVGGGMRLNEPALDLAIAASVVSSFRNKPVPQTTMFMGEIGLTGELRHVSQAAKRVSEARRMGFKKVVLPHSNLKGLSEEGIRLVGVKTLSDALMVMFDGE
ncbi:MAG: DNA repair protein RadA [Christensenellaceae bacterium]|nr:DNA repair protein RadA [Christensenellaceae bacterium]